MKKITKKVLHKTFAAGGLGEFEEIAKLVKEQQRTLQAIESKFENHDFRLDDLKEKLRRVEHYQPIYGVQGVVDTPARQSLDRCEALADAIGDVAGMRILDIGSSLGYVSFYFADRGAEVDGWESNAQNAEIARLASQINGVQNTNFLLKELNQKTVEEVPNNHYDAVVALSVFHHIIRFQGLENTRAIVKSLLEKVPVMFVELAKKGEDPKLPWNDAQPDNELDIFKGLNVDITKIGSFGNHLSSKKRPLYMVKAKQTVAVNGKQYIYDQVSFSAYTKSPLRHQGSLRRKYYFSANTVIKEYGLTSSTEKELNMPEVHQEIATLAALQKLRQRGKLQQTYPRLVDAEVTGKYSRVVLEKVEGELLIDLAERLKDDATKREKIAELVLADVLKQLAELRQLNIYHNDVRSWNIIVGKSGALLIDYGNSSGIPVEDDVVALLWALSGFLTNSRDAGGEEKDLPPQNVFKSYQSLAKAYALIKNGQHEPGRLIEQLNL